jgi:hypothetical protein
VEFGDSAIRLCWFRRGLGTNNFAGRLHDEAARLVLNEALRAGRHLHRHRRRLRPRLRGRDRGLGEPARPPARRTAQPVRPGDQVRHAMSESPFRAWRVAPLDRGRGREQPPPPPDGLHRPLPGPRPGRGDADRGDAPRPRRSGPVGQGSLCRPQQLRRLADRRRRLDRPDEHLARPISAQMHYNLLNRGIQSEVIPACEAHGLGVIPYFPLESAS